MKNLSNKAIPIVLMLAFILLFSQDLIAQPGPPTPPNGGGPPPTPINGLISLALVVGAYFGVKKSSSNSPKEKK